MSLFASHCLACRAREPTHDRGGMLDVVATRDDIPAPVVDVIDVDLSDHHLLRWPMTSARPSPTYVSSVRRLWRRVNVDDLRTAILVSRLAQPALLPDDADVDALAGIYDADMLAIADRLAPARTVTVDRRTRGSTTSVVPPNAPLVLLRSVRRSLSRDSLIRLVVALVLTRLDYCNALLAGLPAVQLNRLQSVINAAARLVCSARWNDHVTPLLRHLHWLKIPERIEYKLCVLAYRCLNGTGPDYLARDLRRVADLPSRQRLRSASTAELVVPATRRKTLGDRSFPVAAARAWNALPSALTSSPSLSTFRRSLKTYLFTKSF
jgi:hypothetical protein